MENCPGTVGSKLQKAADPTPNRYKTANVQLLQEKKQSPVRRRRQANQHRQQRQQQQVQYVPRASPETLKALKKLRKKVRQCAKIQEKMDHGLAVEVNEVEKLNQLNEFKQQIAVLEQEVSTGKAVDNQGFQRVQNRRR